VLTCEQATARATALLEGELGFRQRLSIRLHLAVCVHCRRFYRQMRHLVARLRIQERELPVSEQLVAQIVNAIQRERSDAGESSGSGT